MNQQIHFRCGRDAIRCISTNTTRFARMKALIVCAALWTAPLSLTAQTVYIVDAGDNGADRFLWTQLADAVTALQNGGTLDLSEATPDATQRAIALTDKSVTIKGDADKTYLLCISTNADLVLIDYKSSVTTGLDPNIYLNPAGETSVLTVTGDCSLNNWVAGGGGDSRGARAIEAYKNLTIDGDGTLFAGGITNGIELNAENVIFTVNATVTAINNGEYDWSGNSSREAGILIRGAVSTFTGTGSLNVYTLNGIACCLTFDATPAVNVTFSGLRHLSTGDRNSNAGILLGRWDTQSCTTISATFDLPNPTTIAGGPSGCAIGTGGLANSITTVTNLGAEVDFVATAESRECLYVAGNLVFDGTGAIKITGGRNGIWMNAVNKNITLIGSGAVTVEGTREYPFLLTGTDRLYFSSEAQITVNNSMATAQNIPCTQTGTLLWSVTDDGTITTGNVTDANITVTIPAGSAATPKTTTISLMDDPFVPVTDVALDSPATTVEGTPLTLAGTVTPGDATNQTIVWSVKSAGATGATITGNTLNAPAAGTVTVTATITDGAAAGQDFTKDFTITVTENVILVPFWQIVLMRWNNTLTVINNPAGNGGFTFASYKWFRNSQQISTDQSWSAGANGETINTADRFYVEAVCNDGRKIRTTEVTVTLKSAELKAYPNPVAAGQTLHLDLDIDPDRLQGAVIEVYNMHGRLVETQSIASLREIPIDGKYAAGAYIIVITCKDGYRQEVKISIEN